MKKWRRLVVIGAALLVIIVVFAAVYSCNGRPSNRTTQVLFLPTPPLIDESELDTILPPDAILAIDDPQFEGVKQAQDMAREERVIGIEINGDARAYPLNILSTHELVNDQVGGEPVVITWCPLCYSALVFSRQAADRTLSFGVSGKLLQNTLVMFDRETGSFWSQLYGGAIHGELAGTSLPVFPSVLTEWGAWIVQNPEGKVLSKKLTCAQFNCATYADNPRGSYSVDPYASYYQSTDEGVVDRQIPRDDVSARPKERVLGVRINDAARAYPFNLMSNQPVINDEIDGIPIVIWFNPLSMTGAAFQREVDGRILTFRADESDPAMMYDLETNSSWHGISGKGEAGAYRQSKLKPLVSTPAFEFGWYGYFPQSDTYSDIS